MADSLWNLFLPHLNRAKEIQKPLVFGGVLSPISFAAERNGAAETAGPYGVRGRGRRSRRAEEVTRPRKRGSPADDIPFSIVCALAENYLKKPPQAPRKKRRRADTKTRGLAPQGRCKSDAPRPAHSLRRPAVHHSSGRRRGQCAFSLVQQASSPFEQLLQHAIVLYEKLLSVKAIHGGIRPLLHEAQRRLRRAV